MRNGRTRQLTDSVPPGGAVKVFSSASFQLMLANLRERFGCKHLANRWMSNGPPFHLPPPYDSSIVAGDQRPCCQVGDFTKASPKTLATKAHCCQHSYFRKWQVEGQGRGIGKKMFHNHFYKITDCFFFILFWNTPNRFYPKPRYTCINTDASCWSQCLVCLTIRTRCTSWLDPQFTVVAPVCLERVRLVMPGLVDPSFLQFLMWSMWHWRGLLLLLILLLLLKCWYVSDLSEFTVKSNQSKYPLENNSHTNSLPPWFWLDRKVFRDFRKKKISSFLRFIYFPNFTSIACVSQFVESWSGGEKRCIQQILPTLWTVFFGSASCV